MMKMIHSLYLFACPPAQRPHRPAAHFAGCLRTVEDLSAKGYSLGTSSRAAFCGVIVQHLDTLRPAWPDLVAGASTVTTRHGGTDAPTGSAPRATLQPPGVMWHMPAPCHALELLRTAWRDMVASTVSAPGATPRPPGVPCTCLHRVTPSSCCAPPGVGWWPAP